MDPLMNAEEILEIACDIERNGAAFYRRAGELADSDEARSMLNELAEMEDEHERAFQAMTEALRGENPEWLSKQFEASSPDDPELYLHAAAQGHVFDLDVEPAAQLTASHSLKDVLQIAIGLEKDSVVFYTSLKDAVPDNQGKAKIDDIIREEVQHIALLSRRAAELG